MKLQNSFRNTSRVGFKRTQSELTQTIVMSIINLCILCPSKREVHSKTSFRKVTILKLVYELSHKTGDINIDMIMGKPQIDYNAGLHVFDIVDR